MKFIAQAKVNLNLKVNYKRKDGYHDIATAVTFIDLHDEITINRSKINKNSITYTGEFAPLKGRFNSDVTTKLLKFLYKNEKKKFFLNLNIKKNIPYGSGLGGGSADAGSIIRGLKKLKIINKKLDNKKLSLVGSDIPMCIKSRDCFAFGLGEILYYNIKFPKYYFLLVKPNFSLSTKNVYSKIKFKNKSKKVFSTKKLFISTQNDLEQTAIQINPLIKKLIIDLSKLNDSLQANMTGSGSCCFATFFKLKEAKKACKQIKLKYPTYWSYIAKN